MTGNLAGPATNTVRASPRPPLPALTHPGRGASLPPCSSLTGVGSAAGRSPPQGSPTSWQPQERRGPGTRRLPTESPATANQGRENRPPHDHQHTTSGVLKRPEGSSSLQLPVREQGSSGSPRRGFGTGGGGGGPDDCACAELGRGREDPGAGELAKLELECEPE